MYLSRTNEKNDISGDPAVDELLTTGMGVARRGHTIQQEQKSLPWMRQVIRKFTMAGKIVVHR